jgi:MATE family multidrug resistance protein
LASYMMLGLSSYVMADAIILVSGGVLRGAGDTRWLMIASVSLHWAMLVAQYVVIKVLVLGPRTAWLIFVAMLISMAIVYLMRLLGGAWRTEKALKGVMVEN